jgi:hypothetical protein
MADETPHSLRRQAWLEQKYRAANRRIPFLLTYEEWLGWWQTELAKRGPGARRGRGFLLMCRIGDKGPYALGNIYCGTYKDNAADADMTATRAASRAYFAEHGSWLKGTTGADHPQSRAISTPDGDFPSRTAAAAHYGISRTELRRRIASGRV